MKLITVGSAVGRAGAKVSGFISVPAGVDPGCDIPVSVITGKAEGPTLALVAGTHGGEPCPVLALQHVRAQIDTNNLAGTVILVHCANMPSFTHRTVYRGPYDQKNLNRVYPGKADGTGSERIAHAITTQVIDQCDYLIDMHSGDGNEALRPYSYWNNLGVSERVDTVARELAIAFGITHIVIDRGRPRDINATSFCSNTAHVRGKPAVTTEAGAVGVPTKADVAINVRGALNVLKYLKMLPGKVAKVRPVWIDPSVVLTSPATGTWHQAVKPNQKVRKGQILGTLTDYFGEKITDVKSPMAGTVFYIVVSPAMGKGEPIGMVGKTTRA